MPRRPADDSFDDSDDDEYSPPPRSRSRSRSRKGRTPSPQPSESEEGASDETTETDESDLERGRGRRGGREKEKSSRYYGRKDTGGWSRRGRGRDPPSEEDEEELLSTDPETTSEDDDGPPPRSRLRPRKRRSPLPPADPPDAQDGSQRQLVLILGGVFCLCLLVLGGFAIFKYYKSKTSDSGSADSSSAGSTATVTVTASGQTPVATANTSGGASKASSAAGGSKTSSSASPSGSGSSSSGSSSSGGDGLSGTFTGLSRNQIGIGFLPDGDNGQKMADITDGLSIKSSYYGWYAQLPADGADWDGSQLLNVMDDIKACGCIFQPAVMPTKGWTGLTADNNAQALSIATIMKKFTDEGIEVWLRFAHEVNWYQSDGTYQGDADDFKAGWAAVAAAVADNDMVKMFFTPNIADLSTYQKFFPDDTSTVHIIGIDYYPKSSSESFVDKMQDFYDAYCKDGTIKFAIGETGTGWVATIDERLAWLAQGTAAETATAMPNYVGISWFNYDKEEDFRLFITGDDSVNSATKDWIADGCSESGATIGNA
ncbi:glycoside hydrolase superfamily [Leucosporidium creatinivorum]|uniref:Glycoside hydrolase superfamily n=1 Tax=Leucosporidium creatinivorum TaxID=106004 RepID=A0A1Y2CJ69_9BASI|nr:glycoside hydrolase superfamily [Leucosporidium creatinivorum]